MLLFLITLAQIEPFEMFTDFLSGLNYFCYQILSNGNNILFLFYLCLGIYLITSAKKAEEKSRIYGRNLDFIKKRGRIAALFLTTISILFLLNGLPWMLWLIFNSAPPSPIFEWIPDLSYKNAYNSINFLSDVLVYEEGVIAFLLICGILSFGSVISLSFGIFLGMYNSTLLRTKQKPISYITLGLLLGIVFGFHTWIKLVL